MSSDESIVCVSDASSDFTPKATSSPRKRQAAGKARQKMIKKAKVIDSDDDFDDDASDSASDFSDFELKPAKKSAKKSGAKDEES